MGATSDPGRSVTLAAEALLAALSLTVVVSFDRLLAGPHVLELTVVTLASHVTAAAARRRHLGLVAAAFAVAGAVAVAVTWTLFADTVFLVLPTPATAEAAVESLRAAWASFRTVVAPAPVEPGFLLSAGLGLAFAAFLADWAAFRIWSALEAVIPATTLFVFVTLLGDRLHQVRSGGLFAGAALAFVLAHRVARQATGDAWVTTEVTAASRSLLTAGGVMAAAAAIGGAAIGPLLPGADADAMMSWRSEQARAGQRVTISPLVDIRSRLVDQSDVVVFEVDSTERAYWRLTSLDTFDGGIWKSSGRYSPVNGDLPGEPVNTGDAARIEQVFTIDRLSALWLPAAYEPYAVEAPTDVRYHGGSATLIVDTDVADSNGFVYRVRSAVPRFKADALRAAALDVPEEIAEQYLALPPTTSIMARQLADDWTADAATPYDKALALQAGFQDSFTYDLEAPAGHSPNAIDAFLTSRRGYCEQFAGTYAVMARQLGIPARVAVGFTPGEQVPDAPGRYQVRGEHAHAWPEVWLGEYGWVAFEPTPGRGAPGAEAYTGLPEAQDTSGPDTSATTQTTATTATTVAGGGDDPSTPSTSAAPAPGELEPTGPGEQRSHRSFATLLAQVLVALALVGSLGLAAVPAVARWQRHRRRRHATTDEARVRLAAAEVAGGLRSIGLGPRPHETAHELAGRVAGARPELARALRTLAELTDAACFAPPGTAPDPAGAVEQAEAARDEVLDTVARLVPPRRRIVDAFDPRRLVDHHRGARHVVGPGASRPLAEAGRR